MYVCLKFVFDKRERESTDTDMKSVYKKLLVIYV